MKYLTIVLILFSSLCFSQQHYKFDYLIEYEDKVIDSANSKFIYYLTNSKDNSFIGFLTEFDSLNFKLELVITKTGDIIKTKVLKSAFFKAEFIHIDCQNVTKFVNVYKKDMKHFEVVHLGDTLLNNNKYKYYKVAHTKPQRKKRKKIGTNYYIIENSTEFHLPIITHIAVKEEWELEKNLPFGIYKQRIFYNYLDNLKYKSILKGYYKNNIEIIIPTEYSSAKNN